MKSICNQFTDFNLQAFAATLLPVINLNLIHIGGSHDNESIDGESDGDGSSNSNSDSDYFDGDSIGDDDGDNGDNAGNDGNRFSDEFGDCSHGDRFDGVESLLLDENPISEKMFVPLYPGASVTICAAYCAIMNMS